MELKELLRTLAESGVRVLAAGENLKVQASGERLREDLIEAIRAHKKEILRLIESGELATDSVYAAERVALERVADSGVHPELTDYEKGIVFEQIESSPADVQDIYPLSPIQEGILFHHLADIEMDPYILSTLMSFERREQLDTYIRALNAVIAHHDIFRTALVWDGLAFPVQVVHRSAVLAVEEVSLGSSNIAADLLTLGRSYRFELRRAPLMKAFVSHDAENGRWLLLFLMHHLISDHITLQNLRREIESLLRDSSSVLEVSVPFRRFVEVSRRVRPSEHEAFFKTMLESVDEPTLPYGVMPTPWHGQDICEERSLLDRRLVASLRENARKLGVSVASIFHAAWALIVGRTSNRDDVVFGTVLLGRMDGAASVTRAMGPFINTLPMRVPLTGSVQSTVKQAHLALARLLRHEHASLALAQRCSAVAAPAPLFSALINFRSTVRSGQ
jgi:hypothetical protein